MYKSETKIRKLGVVVEQETRYHPKQRNGMLIAIQQRPNE